MSKSGKTYSSNVKQSLLMDSLKTFFLEKKNLDTIMPIINGDSKISLRVMDWFVTNYSKKNNISYLINNNGKIISDITNQNNGKEFVVYLDYKLQLKGYQKKQFDPFCRRDRINFFYTDKDYITTTVGQLNFFRWAIQNNVLKYIIDNFKKIEEDMNLNTKKKKEQETHKKTSSKGSKKRKKRSPLSVAATRNMIVNKSPITLDFD